MKFSDVFKSLLSNILVKIMINFAAMYFFLTFFALLTNYLGPYSPVGKASMLFGVLVVSFVVAIFGVGAEEH